MEFEYKAKTVEEAIKIGLADLKTTQEEVDIIVLDEGGLFGLRKAKIKIVVEDVKPRKEIKKEVKVEESKTEVKEVKVEEVKEEKVEPKKEIKEVKKVEPKKVEEKVEATNVVVLKKEEKVEEPKKEIKEEKIEEQEEVKEEKELKVSPQELDGFIRKYLAELAKAQFVEVEVEGVIKDGIKVYNLKAQDAHKLIGYHGENLNAMQMITSAVVNEKFGIVTRVLIDIENYREKREESLKILARHSARKVIQTGKPFKLEPMTPNERRIIHTELQHNKKVTTVSTGVEPRRFITIQLKK